jgi:putative transposase
MPETYSQIYIQYVFAVKGKQNLLRKPWRENVFKYISGIIKEKGQKPIIVNGVEDHVHIFVGIKPTMNISDLVRDIKNNSSKFINKQKYLTVKFEWQEGYGVFSYSHSHIDSVYKYIANQEEHHKKKSFKEEYLGFLEKFQVEYNEKYLFDWLEE